MQIIIIPILNTPWKEVSKLESSSRQDRGFGSTGVNKAETKNKHTYQVGEECTKNQEKQIRKLLREYEDTIATSFEDIKGAKVKYQHEIDTGNNRPVKKAPYRVPPNHC